MKKIIINSIVCLSMIANCSVSWADYYNNAARKKSVQLECVANNLSNQSGVDWNDVCFLNHNKGQYLSKREMLINNALDRAERQFIKPSKDIKGDKYSVNSPYTQKMMTPDKKAYKLDPSSEFFYESSDTYGRRPKTFDPFYSDIPKPKKYPDKFDMGTEFYRHSYREPDVMKEQGNFFGINTSYTKKLSDHEHIKSLKDATRDIWPNILKADLRVAWGKVNYEAVHTPAVADNIKDLTYEVRGLAGYDVITDKDTTVTPYMGLGYRYLIDKFTGKDYIDPPFIYKGYDRESNYVYLPMGFDINKDLKSNWSAKINLEYDLFLSGKQKSHLEDVGVSFMDVDGNKQVLDCLDNEQKKGFGIRGSVKLKKHAPELDLFFEPFIRYWNINDSELTQWSSDNGAIVWVYSDTQLPVQGYEPKNNTTEYGFKAGVTF